MSDDSPGAMSELRANWRILAAVIALLWLVEVVDTFLGGALGRFGIWPRELIGLPGVLAAPFLHKGYLHLVGNTVGLFFLGGMLLLRDRSDFWKTTAAGVVSGFAVWAFGRGGFVHIGASGVIFAYFGFLVTIGFFEHKVGSVLLSIAVGLGWGSLVSGALPTEAAVSWEWHAAGLVAGIGVAAVVGRRERLRERD